ncbi:taste receptor type 2 member 10-like [Eleutherodactylus coqui]|uniref:taste receptor type 2 member 10-like n=1 Tax=Eleutherodactylus coqui TaxID=57060 RepID=UPI003462EFA7
MPGIFSNAFIIRTILISNCRTRDMKVIGNLLLVLAICTLCYSCMLVFNIFTFFLNDWIYVFHNLFYTVKFLVVYTTSSSCWFSSCLCFFYFVKIVNIGSGVFMWIQMHINKVISWMIVVSALVSAVSSSLYIVELTKQFARNTSATIINKDQQHVANQRINPNLFFLINCAPIFIMLVTTVSAAITLIKHRQKMSSNLGASTGINTSIYGSAIRTMVYFVVFYSLIVVIMVLYSLSIFDIKHPVFWVLYAYIHFYPVSQSGFIIYGTQHLKKAWLQMMYSVRCNGL